MGKFLKNCSFGVGNRAAVGEPKTAKARGYTIIELMVTVAIVIIAVSIAIPLVQHATNTFKLRSAVASLTGAIQGARFQAISHGYQYQLVLNKAASTYQLQSNPTGAAWGNVGGAIPLSGSSVAATLNQDTTLLFHPSGLVQATTGAQVFNLTFAGSQEQFSVTNYGKIVVTP